MTSTRNQAAVRLVALTAVVALGSGCGIIDTVQNAVDTANALSAFTDRLGRAGQLTYTAEYRITGGEGGQVTIVQQPPRSAVLSADGRLITTVESMTICSGKECQQAPNPTVSAAAGDAALVATVAGPSFVTPELALGLVAAAALVPGSDVSTSERTIAGQETLCADVTDLRDPQGGNEELMQEFSVCVAANGVLASFDGRLNTGGQGAVELVSFSDRVDARAFAPPAGATVVDVTRIQG